MTPKQRAIEILETLSENASWDDILDAFHLDAALMESVAAGERGEVVPHEIVMQRLAQRMASPTE